jgi:hypothetical protein
MRMRLLISVCAAMFAFVAFSSGSIAQQKTAKACAEEWRADKANNQAKGITEKAYVAACRTGTSPSPTAAAPAPALAPAPAATAPAPAAGGQKTAKACTEEWRADKANNQAKGITEKAYVAACRNGTTPSPTAAAPAPAPAPAPTATAPSPAPAAPSVARTAPSPAAPAPRAPSAGTPSGSGQFATEAQAKSHCPSDTVVWANLNSKIYHFSGTHNYGNTKSGAYMCESETSAAGIRAAKNEAHP